jgi:WD40 repeat protein
VASAGFIADVYIWEVLFQKDNGEFLGLNKVMDLKGHHAGVTGVAFSRDNKLATVCKDRTIRVWNIEVRYKLGEDAKLLFSLDPWDTQVDLLHVTFSPKGDLLAVAGNDSVAFYSLDTRQVVTVLRQCTGRTTVDIKKFGFSGDGTLLATLGQGQQWISLWNIPAMPSFSSVHP